MLRQKYVGGLAFLLAIDGVVASLFAGAPSPTTGDPVAQSSGTIATTVRSDSFSLGLSSSNQLFWFTYVSDGKSAVKFDTLGSNFSTGGGGFSLPISNESQIAVYTSSGAKVLLAKGDQDIAGNPVAVYPYYSSTDPTGTSWYNAQGLTQAYLTPNGLASNPHWLVSPTDTTPLTGWSAAATPLHPLGNAGNSQQYFPPNYYVPLNEYQVWNTALSPIVLNNQGQPVDRNGNVVPAAQAQPQPGWRYGDRDRVGPGEAWNRSGILPAGTYYIAVATGGLVLSGDTGAQDVLEAPVNFYFDPDTFSEVGPVSILSGPLGSFQYYQDPGGTSFSGTLNFNVTKGAALEWNNAGGSGNGTLWDVSGNQNFNDSTAPVSYTPGDFVTFDDNNNGHYNVTLNSAVSPFAVNVISNGNYVLSGNGSINGTGGFTKSGTGTFTLATHNTYTGETVVNQGTLNVSGAITGSAITVAAGATLNFGNASSLYASIPEYASGAATPVMVAPNLNIQGTVSIGPGIAGSGLNVLAINILTMTSTSSLSLGTAANHADHSLLEPVQFSLPLGAKLDLGGNDLIMHNGSLATLITELTQGSNVANHGYWNGSTGITSSAAISDPRHITTLGYRQSDGSAFDGVNTVTTDVLVKYTYYGDADLNGILNGSDYHQIDLGFGGHLTGWGNGDFNYDGVVNGSDYALIDNAFNQFQALGANPMSLSADATALIASDASASSVPEPASFIAVLLPIAGLVMRRRPKLRRDPSNI